ncbi:MAG TPA: GNAT family N-acetyltransferase [Pyrinomonadaceae bacterium]|nr:GNAT family N-acetyltransferase [Pyrinomonadaceae bacterium]
MISLPAEHNLPGDDHVVLTFFHASDAAALRELDADPEHRLRFEFPEDFLPSLEHSERVIADWTRARDRGGPFVFAVRAVVADGELLGGCEIRLMEKHVANLSYFTLARHRSRGVASRAVALACQIAKTSLSVKRLEIVVEPDNVASRRVAMRNGFRETGMRNNRILYLKDISDRQKEMPR